MNSTSAWNRLWILPLLLLMIASCGDGSEESSRENRDDNSPPGVSAIREWLSGQTISVLDMGRTLVRPENSAIYSHISSRQKYKEPKWKTCTVHHEENGTTVYLFDLESEEPLSCLVKTRDEGKRHDQVDAVISKLVVLQKGDKRIARVLTYIPDAEYSRSHESLSDLGFDVSDGDFSGLRLLSTLDGIFLYGSKYKDGVAQYDFLPTKFIHHPVDSVSGVSRSEIDEKFRKLSDRHIYFRLFGKSSNFVSRLSRSDESGLRCSFCGKLVDDCTCVTIVAPYLCKRCHREKADCVCLEPCPTCGSYFCTCYASGGSGGGSGSSGGSSSGSSGGGGSSNSGSSGNGSGNGDSSLPELGSTSTIKPNVVYFFPASEYIGREYNTNCLSMSEVIRKRMVPFYASCKETRYYIRRADKEGNLLPKNRDMNDREYSEFFDLISQSLEEGKPLKVGLRYKENKKNTDNPSDYLTDHWVLITGRKYDEMKGQYYFIYIETARNKSNAKYAVGDNRLYYDEKKDIISGLRYTKIETYILNQIRVY